MDELLERLDAHRKSPEMAPYCGRYLFDGNRQYGFTFEQLKSLLADYNDPKSVHYQKGWGFTSLFQWLYEVNRTSIGDLHGDLPKHVVVTYHRPGDFSEEEMEAKDKEYDAFWEESKKLGT